MASKTENRVFLNVPYLPSYEPVFLAIVAAVTCVGRIPTVVAEHADQGKGRLRRIHEALVECPVSFHDLSFIGTPVRFNMPFELGLACGLRMSGRPHEVFVFEAKRFRLQKTLSDYNGIDPQIHEGKPQSAIRSVLNCIGRQSGEIRPPEVAKVLERLRKAIPTLKKTHGSSTLYSG